MMATFNTYYLYKFYKQIIGIGRYMSKGKI